MATKKENTKPITSTNIHFYLVKLIFPTDLNVYQKKIILYLLDKSQY